MRKGQDVRVSGVTVTNRDFKNEVELGEGGRSGREEGAIGDPAFGSRRPIVVPGRSSCLTRSRRGRRPTTGRRLADGGLTPTPGPAAPTLGPGVDDPDAASGSEDEPVPPAARPLVRSSFKGPTGATLVGVQSGETFPTPHPQDHPHSPCLPHRSPRV